MPLTIAFVGPIAKPNTPAKGGFEAANRRTIDLLKPHKIDVLEYAYPEASGGTARKTLTYLLGYGRIAMQLIRQRREWQLMHITPLLRQFALPELALVGLAKGLGKPVLLDIRAGSYLKNYAAYGPLYRWLMDTMGRLSTQVAIEGTAYAAHFKAKGVKTPFHFPNFVKWDETLESLKRPTPTKPYTLLLFGRIVKEKGAETAIETLRLLQAKTPNAFTLTFVGSGDETYLAKLREKAQGLPVTFAGAMPYAQARQQLAQAAIFLFPTTHEGEGQSNALTEAMAHGCVPVCADNGFNAEVVANTGVILPKFAEASSYAAALEALTPAKLKTLSQAAHTRIKTTYADGAVMASLVKVYKTLLA